MKCDCRVIIVTGDGVTNWSPILLNTECNYLNGQYDDAVRAEETFLILPYFCLRSRPVTPNVVSPSVS